MQILSRKVFPHLVKLSSGSYHYNEGLTTMMRNKNISLDEMEKRLREENKKVVAVKIGNETRLMVTKSNP